VKHLEFQRRSVGIVVSVGSALALLALVGATAVPNSSFPGYHWPEHQSFSYATSLTNMLAAQVAVPNSELSKTAKSGTTAVALTEVEDWAPPMTVRTGGVKDGGLFVEVTYAASPLTVRVRAPQPDEDQGQSVSIPALTTEGRLSPNGQWTVIQPLTAEGPMPDGISPGSFVPTAQNHHDWMPPVPARGWVSGQSFIHQVTINADSLAKSALSSASAVTISAKPWRVPTTVTPQLNAHGNWELTLDGDTPTPLEARVTANVAGEGSVSFALALTVKGTNQLTLLSQEGGLLKHQDENETLTMSTQAAGTKANASLNEHLKETLSWIINEQTSPTAAALTPKPS
jgi:hypothetical protein